MSNIFVVQSPLQLLGAIEATSRFPGGAQVLVMILWPPAHSTTRAQMERLAALVEWSEVVRLSPATGMGRFRFPYRKVSDATERHGCRRLFIGDIGSDYMRGMLIRASALEPMLLDDGVASIIAQDWFLTHGAAVVSMEHAPYDYGALIGKGKRPWLAGIRNRIKRVQVDHTHLTAPVGLFTALDLPACPGQRVERHRFEGLRQQFPVPDPQRLNHECWFFGAGMSEYGGWTVNEEIHIVSRIVDHYRDRGISVRYFRHRHEDPVKLRTLAQSLDLAIEEPDLPAELAVLQRSAVAGHMAAYLSSVLTTLPAMVDFTSVTSFRVRNDRWAMPEFDDQVIRYLSGRVDFVEISATP